MSAAGSLRVAFFGHAEGRRADGLSTYSRELVGALRRRGCTVRFVSHAEDGDVLPVAPADALQLVAWHFKTVTIPQPGHLHRIRSLLSAFEPDVVHISWSFSLLDGAIAREAHAHGALCVATFHLPHGPARTFRGWILQRLYDHHAARMTHVDAVVALSEEQAALLARAGYPRDRITVVSNGVDADSVTPGSSPLRQQLGARLVALYMGRLDPEKRVVPLVEAFLALQMPEDVVLCIAGDGSQRHRLQEMARTRPAVRLLGLVTDEERRLELLRGCDVLVLPSTAEGLALSLLEGMAAGRCIIATDAGEDGRALAGAGLVIPVHPLRPALDEALARALADPELRERLGRAARERALRDYSLGATVEQVLAVYRSAAAAAAAPVSALP